MLPSLPDKLKEILTRSKKETLAYLAQKHLITINQKSMYSLTQGGNLTAIIGLVATILSLFKVNIAPEELQAVAGAVITLIGIITSWYGRYRKGDLTLGGYRK